MEEGPFIVLTLDLEQAAILNAAIAHYWIHMRQSTSSELRPIASQVADVQRLLVEKVHELRKGEPHASIK
ncbi:hypothetical protein KSF_092020 [Reticulibacter mediterranei]|uniref:Uncharacterized protein n=1 Tax=Reticulibacter mediterranei TaxID=2778369 RepID=A0A8J3IWH8_9CHLR|nr:hypothetical protein [Reticulibacter mediterranei]GHO99154.1 hypothetical protein KSF_092020 [Reticulibacter mediterranei]